MEIDVKKEQERVQAEVKELVNQTNQINDSMNLLQQQRQEVINRLLMKQGELELLKRLDGVEEESTVERVE